MNQKLMKQYLLCAMFSNFLFSSIRNKTTKFWLLPTKSVSQSTKLISHLIKLIACLNND